MKEKNPKTLKGTSSETRQLAEFKHIIKRRKKKSNEISSVTASEEERAQIENLSGQNTANCSFIKTLFFFPALPMVAQVCWKTTPEKVKAL
jgi:hypothetical protein